MPLNVRKIAGAVVQEFSMTRGAGSSENCLGVWPRSDDPFAHGMKSFGGSPLISAAAEANPLRTGWVVASRTFTSLDPVLGEPVVVRCRLTVVERHEHKKGP